MGSCDRFESLGSGSAGPKMQGDPMNSVQNFLSDESGVTAIEYALIASLIAVFIVGALQVVGTNLSTVFTEVGGSLK